MGCDHRCRDLRKYDKLITVQQLSGTADEFGHVDNTDANNWSTYSTAWNEVGQGFKDFSPRMESMETAMLQKRVRHGLHPVLNLGAASAIAVMDGSSNRRLMKNKSSQKIDGIVAMTMAVHPHVVQLEEGPVAAIGWV